MEELSYDAFLVYSSRGWALGFTLGLVSWFVRLVGIRVKSYFHQAMKVGIQA